MRVLYPGVASVGGDNGTQWRSEVVLANPAEVAADVVLELVPRGQSGVIATLALTLARGETRRLPDLYAAMKAPSGAGLLRVKGDVLAWVRTFNQGSPGSFGQDVPPVTSASAWPADIPAQFPINTPSNAKTEFRSNLLLVNLEPTPLTFTVMSGALSKTSLVPAGAYTQISGVGSWLGLAAGPAVIQVSAPGEWSGTVSTVDPVLGDPTTMRGLVATSRGSELFPGVALAGGDNGTQWRSEVVLFNPGFLPQVATLEIVPRGATAMVASTTVPLGAMEVRRIADLYTTVGAPAGVGMLRVKGNVLTWVRTFNQGVGTTFGQDVPEVTPGIGFGPGAVVALPISTPADKNVNFRSNFLVVNHESHTITCTLTAGTSTRTFDVAPGAYAQQSGVGTWLGVAPGFATMSVSATGRWSGTVSTIDPYLGDPTTMVGLLTTPNPVPTATGEASGDAVTVAIGPAGGTVSSADGRAELIVPSGALSTTTSLTLQPVSNTAHGGVGTGYRLGPAGTTFSKPATLTFTATIDDVASGGVQGMGVALQDGVGYWHWMPSVVRDQATRRVAVAISKLAPPAAPLAAPPGLDESPRSAWAAPANQGLGSDTDAALVRALTLVPNQAMVEEGKQRDLQIQVCYAAGASTGEDDPLANLGTTCSGWSQSQWGLKGMQIWGDRWSVNGLLGGSSALGTIVGYNRSAVFTAPGTAPKPETVQASVLVTGSGLSNTLSSFLTIGKPRDYVGTLGIQADENLTFRTTFKFEAKDLTLEFQKQTTGPSGAEWSWLMSGTVTNTTGAVKLGGIIPCTLVTGVTQPVKPSWFQYRLSAKTVHWVLEPITWTYQCQGTPIPLTFALKFHMSEAADCRTEVWKANGATFPDGLAGSFTDSCSQGVIFKANWNLVPKER